MCGRDAHAKVSIRRTDLCAFERPYAQLDGARYERFQSVERICVPSNSWQEVVWYCQTLTFQSVERICVPSNYLLVGGKKYPVLFQSVERICVPSNPFQHNRNTFVEIVSIRRTDLCAFEPVREEGAQLLVQQFQSVERGMR